MPGVIFDTSVWIAYQPERLPAGFLMSAVVIQELTAGATDKSNLQKWEAVYRAHEKQGTLLVPTGEDWWLAGKVLNSLLRGERRAHAGRTPKKEAEFKQRIIRDVLIARTARRAGAVLITDNLKDFQMIRRFCAVQITSGADYFK